MGRNLGQLTKAGKAFVSKKTSSNKPPHIVSAVNMPQLVGSPHLRSAHLGIGQAFVPKRASSDKPPHMFSVVYRFMNRLFLRSFFVCAYYAFLKKDLGHMATLVTFNGSFSFAVHRFLPHYGV